VREYSISGARSRCKEHGQLGSGILFLFPLSPVEMLKKALPQAEVES
jgi:hypothetical protein